MFLVFGLVRLVGREYFLDEVQEKKARHDGNGDDARTEYALVVRAEDGGEEIETHQPQQQAGGKAEDEVEAVPRPQRRNPTDAGGYCRHAGKENGFPHSPSVSEMKIISKIAFYGGSVKDVAALLQRCRFGVGELHLAVSGGADSVGMALLAAELDRPLHLHHVNHHLRATAAADGVLVQELAARLGATVTRYDVYVEAGPNLEARARAARRGVLPAGVLTGHTADDLAETTLLNVMWGAGIDGWSSMWHDATKPILALRRAEVLDVVRDANVPYVVDESNDDQSLRRNAIRHDLIPRMNEIAQRDVVPIIARQSAVMADERAWLETLTAPYVARELEDVDCRELVTWPNAVLRRWLRAHLRSEDRGDGTHPPSSSDVERALRVVRGEVVASELSGGRRLRRSNQRLSLE